MIPSSFSRLTLCAGALLFGGLFFVFPAQAAQGVQRGLLLCGQSVIPSLFPYMVICAVLVGNPEAVSLLSLPLRPLCRLMGRQGPGFSAFLLLCLLGGFAGAACCIRQGLQQGRLTRRQARMLCFCGLYASPAFAANALPGAGPLLLASGFLGGIVCCLLAPLFCPPETQTPPLPPPPDSAAFSLPQAVEQTTFAMVKICGFVVFFSFLTGVLGAGPLVCALLEMAGGCAACQTLTGGAALYACRAVLSWLGICAFCQVDALLPAGLPRRTVLWGRFVHMGFSLLFLRLLTGVFAPAAQVYSSLAPRVLTYHRMKPDAALLLFALCCLVLRRLDPSAGQK